MWEPQRLRALRASTACTGIALPCSNTAKFYSQSWSSLENDLFPWRICTAFSTAPCLLHARQSHSWLILRIFYEEYNYEDHHCVIVSILLLFLLSNSKYFHNFLFAISLSLRVRNLVSRPKQISVLVALTRSKCIHRTECPQACWHVITAKLLEGFH
jgi:hypothetical protein